MGRKRTGFPLGARVEYATDGADVGPLRARGELTTTVGTVNGRPVTDPATGKVAYVPVWTAREGREATTIYVAVGNILTVTIPAVAP